MFTHKGQQYCANPNMSVPGVTVYQQCGGGTSQGTSNSAQSNDIGNFGVNPGYNYSSASTSNNIPLSAYQNSAIEQNRRAQQQSEEERLKTVREKNEQNERIMALNDVNAMEINLTNIKKLTGTNPSNKIINLLNNINTMEVSILNQKSVIYKNPWAVKNIKNAIDIINNNILKIHTELANESNAKWCQEIGNQFEKRDELAKDMLEVASDMEQVQALNFLNAGFNEIKSKSNMLEWNEVAQKNLDSIKPQFTPMRSLEKLKHLNSPRGLSRYSNATFSLAEKAFQAGDNSVMDLSDEKIILKTNEFRRIDDFHHLDKRVEVEYEGQSLENKSLYQRLEEVEQFFEPIRQEQDLGEAESLAPELLDIALTLSGISGLVKIVGGLVNKIPILALTASNGIRKVVEVRHLSNLIKDLNKLEADGFKLWDAKNRTFNMDVWRLIPDKKVPGSTCLSKECILRHFNPRSNIDLGSDQIVTKYAIKKYHRDNIRNETSPDILSQWNKYESKRISIKSYIEGMDRGLCVHGYAYEKDLSKIVIQKDFRMVLDSSLKINK